MKNVLKFKLIFFSLIIGLIITGCNTAMFGTKYQYYYGLIKKDSVSTKIDSAKVMKFSDELIDVEFTFDNHSIHFTIKNKTSDVMKIIWDDASIIQFGISHKIVHNNVKFDFRYEPQLPSVIPANSAIIDMAEPSDNIFYNGDDWDVKGLFPVNDFSIDSLYVMIMGFKGENITLYFPIYYQGNILDYYFHFIVTKVRPIYDFSKTQIDYE